ncbi:MAG: phosphoribosylamine--glycine ligase, partial [Candidatus Dormibacteraeota bacterium]|nr:phosphoribosylamine--glycine ligase [Candidatus Dormibacteraeota bacterium]
SAGYPGTPRTGDVISGLDDVDDSTLVFQAGTQREPDGTMRTSGGRVLCIVAIAGSPQAATASAYENLGRVHFDGMQYRSDIGVTTIAAPRVTV